MTIIIRRYVNNNNMRNGKVAMAQQGFRSVHTDFINNDVRQGYEVTFDNTPSVLPPKIEMTAGEFIDLLMEERDIIQKPSTITRFRTLLRLN